MSGRRSSLADAPFTIGVCVVCGLLCLGLGLFAFPRAAQAQAAPPEIPCPAVPQRSCVLEQAVAAALAIDDPLNR